MQDAAKFYSSQLYLKAYVMLRGIHRRPIARTRSNFTCTAHTRQFDGKPWRPATKFWLACTLLEA